MNEADKRRWRKAKKIRSLFADEHGRPPANLKELEQWVTAESNRLKLAEQYIADYRAAKPQARIVYAKEAAKPQSRIVKVRYVKD